MTLHRFRTAAVVLIAFNLLGTVVTWVAHLSKPGTSDAHAIAAGTEFTGPLFFIAMWVVCVAALWANGRVATVALWLMTIFALGYSAGEASELLKSNIGVSSAKWDTVIALDVVGLAVALSVVALGAMSIVAQRRVATAH